MIYFITTPSKVAVKIGFAENSVSDRVATLQTAHWEELILIGVISGTVRQEKKIHALLAGSGFRGEWFKYTTHVSAIVKAVSSGIADADSIIAYLSEVKAMEREARDVALIARRKRTARRNLATGSPSIREFAAELLVTLKRAATTSTTARGRALYARLRARKVEAVSRRITT